MDGWVDAQLLYSSEVPNAVFSVNFVNLTSVNVTKLLIFVKECPLRFHKNSREKICYAEKAHMHFLTEEVPRKYLGVCMYQS